MQTQTELTARSTRLPHRHYEAEQHRDIVRRIAFGLNAILEQNLKMGAVFTLVSIVRSYALRRVFNALQQLPPARARLTGGCLFVLCSARLEACK